MAAKSGLQRVQILRRTERLDGGHLAPFRLHAEQQTGARRVPVDEHRAGAADPVLAAQVGAGQPQAVAQRVGQRHSRLHVELHLGAVDGKGHLGHATLSSACLRHRSTRAWASRRR